MWPSSVNSGSSASQSGRCMILGLDRPDDICLALNSQYEAEGEDKQTQAAKKR